MTDNRWVEAAEVLASYRPEGEAEVRDVSRVNELVKAAADPWLRSLPLHLTASALVVHPGSGRVLLRWHRRQQAWLQVGGHGDPGETDPLAIALREATEETGLKDLVPWPDAYLRHVAIVDVPPGKGEPAHQHGDLRFVLATDHPEEATAESRNAPLRWLTVADAEAEAGPDNLRETLRRVGPLLAAGPSAGAAPVALADIDAAAAALQATAEGLTAEQASAPSLLPGWSRGHVLTHVARNADALANLLHTARTGEPRAAYASAEAREAAIDAGAARHPAELAADLARSAAAWRAEAVELPESSRFTLVAVLGDAFPAAQVLTRRWHETVLHHTDLGTGYGPAGWPAAYTALDLPPRMAAQRADRLNGAS